MCTRVQPGTVAFLAAAGFLASFIDSQVGGGGVITLPALLAAGLPRITALATNKVGGTSSALIASANYVHKGAVPWRQALLWAPLSLVGGAVGVWAVLHAGDTSWLTPAILAVMLGMTVYVLVRPRFGKEDRLVPGWMPVTAMALAALDIGVYDGVLGPGTGSLLIFSLVTLVGAGFTRAAALGRVMNLASNLSSLAYWVASGHVDWTVGIPMALSMAVGGYVGSHVGLKHGDRYLKPLFVAVTAVLMVRLGGQMLHVW